MKSPDNVTKTILNLVSFLRTKSEISANDYLVYFDFTQRMVSGLPFLCKNVKITNGREFILDLLQAKQYNMVAGILRNHFHIHGLYKRQKHPSNDHLLSSAETLELTDILANRYNQFTIELMEEVINSQVKWLLLDIEKWDESDKVMAFKALKNTRILDTHVLLSFGERYTYEFNTLKKTVPVDKYFSLVKMRAETTTKNDLNPEIKYAYLNALTKYTNYIDVSKETVEVDQTTISKKKTTTNPVINFDYSTNNGSIIIEENGRKFGVTFNKASNTSIHLNNYDNSISKIARVKGVEKSDRIDFNELDRTSDTYTIQLGETHDYQLYLALNQIDHTKTKVRSPQTNGICERFHRTILDEFYRITFRKNVYETMDQLQKELDIWLEYYNTERTHQGKICCGRTPMQTLNDGKLIWMDKFVDQV